MEFRTEFHLTPQVPHQRVLQLRVQMGLGLLNEKGHVERTVREERVLDTLALGPRLGQNTVSFGKILLSWLGRRNCQRGLVRRWADGVTPPGCLCGSCCYLGGVGGDGGKRDRYVKQVHIAKGNDLQGQRADATLDGGEH